MKSLFDALKGLPSALGETLLGIREDITVALRKVIALLLFGAVTMAWLALNAPRILGWFGIPLDKAILIATFLPVSGMLILAWLYPVEMAIFLGFKKGRNFLSRLMMWLTIEIGMGLVLWLVSGFPQVAQAFGVLLLLFLVQFVAYLVKKAGGVWAMTLFLAVALILGLLFSGQSSTIRDAVVGHAQSAWAAGEEKAKQAWANEQKKQEEEKARRSARDATANTAAERRAPEMGIFTPIVAAAEKYVTTNISSGTTVTTLECGNPEDVKVLPGSGESIYIVPPCKCIDEDNCTQGLKFFPERMPRNWQMEVVNLDKIPGLPYEDQCVLFAKYKKGRQPVGIEPMAALKLGGCGDPRESADVTIRPEGSSEEYTTHLLMPDVLIVHNVQRSPIRIKLKFDNN